MSKVSPTKKQYRSMRGKSVDIDLLRKRHELTPAVGNARVNARGDELGAGGAIIKKREEVIQEHYATAGTAKQTNLARAKKTSEPIAEPVVETKTTTKTKKAAASVIEEELSNDESAELAAMDDGWVEDEEGNFVPKGEV